MTSTPYTSLIVDIFAGSDGESELYEDDGETEGYKNGECRITKISYTCKNGEHKISFVPSGNYENAPEKRDITVKLKGIDRPSYVFDGCALEYREDERCAVIAVNSANADNAFEIVLS